MRRKRFQRGGLSQRKRNGRLYWYLQWREDGQARSKELALCSEISRAGAEVIRAEIMEPINKGALKSSKPVYTLEKFIEKVYLPVSRRKWKASTTMTTEALIKAHVLELGPRLISELAREELQKFLDRKASAGISKSVLSHLYWQLHAVFRLAMGDGVVEHDPTLGLCIPSVAVPAVEKRWLSFQEVQQILQVLPVRERVIFRLATIEGMRPGEILGLQIRDFAGRSLRISRRVYRNDVDTPKNGRPREVALSGPTASLLEEWIGMQLDQRLEAWIFQSENVKRPLMRDNVQRRFLKPKLENIGFGWVTFQVMRRTNASLAHKRGIDPKVAADQRGHGLGVSLSVYTQTDLEQKLKAVGTLDSAVIQ